MNTNNTTIKSVLKKITLWGLCLLSISGCSQKTERQKTAASDDLQQLSRLLDLSHLPIKSVRWLSHDIIDGGNDWYLLAKIDLSRPLDSDEQKQFGEAQSDIDINSIVAKEQRQAIGLDHTAQTLRQGIQRIAKEPLIHGATSIDPDATTLVLYLYTM